MENRFRLAAQAMSDLIYEWDIIDDTLRWYGDIDGALGHERGEVAHTIEAWIERILMLHEAQLYEQLETELAAFRQAYPDYPLPPPLQD